MKACGNDSGGRRWYAPGGLAIGLHTASSDYPSYASSPETEVSYAARRDQINLFLGVNPIT